MKIANIEFNVDSLSKITRDQFVNLYKGKLMADINKSADFLNEYFKKEEVVYNTEVEEAPKRKRRRK